MKNKLTPRQAAMEAYLSALRLRDLETCRHSLRVSRLVYEMAQELAWSEDRCRKLKEGALLHDLGKLATPDPHHKEADGADDQRNAAERSDADHPAAS